MKSMTGFGEAFAENPRYRVSATLRSVNHRFLDLAVRLPDEYRSLEKLAGEIVRGELTRGRVELRIGVDSLQRRPVDVELRKDLLRQLLSELDALQSEDVAVGPAAAADLLRLPQVLTIRESPPDWTADDGELVRKAVTEALNHLVGAREVEGAGLLQVVLSRLDELGQLVDRLETRRRQVEVETIEVLRERVGRLLDDESLPQERLAQEAVLLVERSDVREELDRLAVHLEHFRALAEAEGPHGRRLEFLLQEIVRELNTTGGKCRDAEMGRDVVDGKVVCEQLREQLLNVE